MYYKYGRTDNPTLDAERYYPMLEDSCIAREEALKAEYNEKVWYEEINPAEISVEEYIDIHWYDF